MPERDRLVRLRERKITSGMAPDRDVAARPLELALTDDAALGDCIKSVTDVVRRRAKAVDIEGFFVGERRGGGLLSELLERARELRQNSTNTQADLDAAEASAAQAAAAIESTKATLAKKRIVAPFAGRVGIRQVNPGQFLNKADVVVSLEATDPIYADFSLPQQDVTQLRPGLPVKVGVDAFAGREFSGVVEAIDPRVNGTTRNLRVRASLPNPDETLRPGMFVRVDVVLPEENEVVVLPATAIVYSPYGDSVYVVAKDDKGVLAAQQRFVKVGPKRGDQISLLEGVKAGEEVVTAGQGKLRPGTPVTINNTVVPTNNPTPTPAES